MPCLLPRTLARRPPPWICTACLRRAPSRPRPRPRTPHALFHSTPPRPSDSTPNHYDTLHLPPHAAPADIKRQFYTLSKKHHPDRNPADPTASTRFVAISEAYHVLSVPEKRAQYDASLHARDGRGRGTGRSPPTGSYSSASFGARPASGLNKKRSTFRGPPPSFYKAGGYGQHGAKRADYAHHSPGPEAHARPESYGEWGGFGPGQQRQGNEVPHFDDRRHKETHDGINEHVTASRRKAASRVPREEDYDRGDVIVNFILVSAIIAFIGATTTVFSNRKESTDTAKKKEDS